MEPVFLGGSLTSTPASSPTSLLSSSSTSLMRLRETSLSSENRPPPRCSSRRNRSPSQLPRRPAAPPKLPLPTPFPPLPLASYNIMLELARPPFSSTRSIFPPETTGTVRTPGLHQILHPLSSPPNDCTPCCFCWNTTTADFRHSPDFLCCPRIHPSPPAAMLLVGDFWKLY